MEELEKKLKKSQKRNSKLGWFFIVLAVILVGMGIMLTQPDKTTWGNFNGTNSGEYVKTEIYYLIGPFAEYTEGEEVTEQLYTAFTKEHKNILVATGKTTDLPILGETVTEENIDSIEPVTIYGHSTILDSDVESYLVEYWNEIYEVELFTTSNYKQYFGYCYLDTTNTGEETPTVCYILAAIFGVIGIVALLGGRNTNKNNKNILKQLEEEGKLEDLKSEYIKENMKEYKELNLDLTENHIVSYGQQLIILPYEDIINAYHSNMIKGVYQPCMYIALETKNDQIYYIAQKPLDSKNTQFDEVLEEIRAKVKQGGN